MILGICAVCAKSTCMCEDCVEKRVGNVCHECYQKVIEDHHKWNPPKPQEPKKKPLDKQIEKMFQPEPLSR